MSIFEALQTTAYRHGLADAADLVRVAIAQSENKDVANILNQLLATIEQRRLQHGEEQDR